MEYVNAILDYQKMILEKILSEWEEPKHPEARKIRASRLKEINKAIKILNENK
jgi:hypothetical protein